MLKLQRIIEHFQTDALFYLQLDYVHQKGLEVFPFLSVFVVLY